MTAPRALAALLAALALSGPGRAAAGDGRHGLLVPRALATPERAWVFGRVLEDAPHEAGPAPVRTARSLLASNQPGEAVEVRLLGQVGRARSGHDGEFEVELEAPADRPFPPGVHRAEVRAGGAVARAEVEVVGPGAPFLLVSDFDDTVAVSHVTRPGKLLRATFLQDGDTQPAVPGMAALYRCLAAGGAPVAFVSGSPFQLAPRLRRFLERNRFPPAALLLRNLGTSTLRGGYKEPALERLAARFPALPMVLVGDSGEKDPEVYAAFARAHPGKVARIYVRRAEPGPVEAQRVEGALLFDAPAEAARDAAGRGLMDPACKVP